MHIAFTKMHGLGNDFAVIDGTRAAVKLTTTQIRRLTDRREGVGCDQVLIVTPPRGKETDFDYRIFNADGGEVEQCGNGVRCIAKFITDRALSGKPTLRLGSLGGVAEVQTLDDGQVRVNMGAPKLAPADIPFDANAQALTYALNVSGQTVDIGVVSMGNPHAVLQVLDTATAPVARLGPAVEAHPRFPQRTNVEFLQKLAPDNIRLRVYERGVGETRACGTGACAAMVWGRLAGELGDTVNVDLPGGRLVISWQGAGAPVWMTGPAETVFEGTIEL